jgi:hypothetical protein
MTIHVCSFASKSFLLPQSRQRKELIDIGFDESHVYPLTDKTLGENFYKKVSYASENNKFGFFSFKPFLLEQILLTLPENDMLIYMDVNDRPLKGLKEYVEKKMSLQRDINILAASTNYPNIRQCSYFHRSRLSFFATLASFFKFQPEAGVLIIRNNRETQALLRAWTELTLINSDALEKVDDVRSRHDQETLFFLSLLNKSIQFESWYQYRFLKLGLRKYIQWEYYRELMT